MPIRLDERQRAIITNLARMGLPQVFRERFITAADAALGAAAKCEIKELPDTIQTMGYYTTFLKENWVLLFENLSAGSWTTTEHARTDPMALEQDIRALLDDLTIDLVIALNECGCQSGPPGGYTSATPVPDSKLKLYPDRR